MRILVENFRMNNLFAFYNSRISKYEQALKKVKKQLLLSSMLRLFVFLLAVCMLVFFIEKINFLLPSLLLLAILFGFLVSKHTNLQYKRDRTSKLIQINKTEIEVLKRNFSNLPDGSEFMDPLHYFSQDIDLFGKNSFFQYLNRTSLPQGMQRLAKILTANEIENIVEKQVAIAELAKKVDFRQEFSATAGFVETEIDLRKTQNTFRDYTFFTPNVASWLPLTFSIVSIGLACGWYWNLWPAYTLLIWGAIGFIIQKIFSKNVDQLSGRVSIFQNTFQSYHRLLELIEDVNFSSEYLLKRQKKILSKKEKSSALMKYFSETIDSLDQRNIFIFGALANLFFLWDLRYSHRLEKWIKQNGEKIPLWIDVIQFLDAQNSIGNFAFNHPEYIYPKIENGATIMDTKNAVHPLIEPSTSVKNNYQIKEGEFFIITGANMAGKSTFLRTLSLQIVMSNIGLPICATKCLYSPIKLITSMRTTDSLSDGSSYFYSELTRLKFIVDELKKDRYFIVLDEILKGTNSRDKAIGSRKFIQKLIHSHSTGIIATHDLGLCEAANEFPEIKNYYFDVEIIGNELHFDYTIHEGICKNMNASFLLKKMGITD